MEVDGHDSKRAVGIELAGLPYRLQEVFDGLERAGVQACCLFGGAARDADLGALWGEPLVVKDYDLRAWLDPDAVAQEGWEARFAARLASAFPGASVELEPSAGSGRLRHVVRWDGLELDVSARARPSPDAGSVDCAVERALDADASLSAVAIASDMSAWCEELYRADRVERQLSFYPGTDPERLAAYAGRMGAKFPGIPARFLCARKPCRAAKGPG